MVFWYLCALRSFGLVRGAYFTLTTDDTLLSGCIFYTVVVVVVVVLTLTHNTMLPVVAGQAPTTLEWKKCLGSKTEAKTKKQAYAFRH